VIARALAGAAALLALPLAVAAAEPLYPAIARANDDIAAACKEAKAAKKRVLLDFGGNWCTDCKVLDINFRKAENKALLDASYVVVHVNIGDKRIDSNLDVGERYGIPLKKGVPALAVLDGDGKVIHAQKNGEFESMRSMDPKSVHEFLAKWAGPAR
jgi:thiol:disulfide interchange protein